MGKVVIKIIGGIAHVTECPDGVDVEIRDFDIEGVTGVEFSEDENGDGLFYYQSG
jgi:hypothetical protein